MNIADVAIEWISIFNNREIAIAIWLIGFFSWALTMPKVRESFPGVLKAAFAAKLTICWILTIGYIAIVTVALWGWGIWSVTNLKMTILWAFSAGLVMVVGVASDQPDRRRLWQSTIGGFKASLVLEFVANLYVFPLWVELVLMPVATLIVGTAVFAESKKENQNAVGCLNNLMSLLGVGLLGYGVYRITTDFDMFWQVETLIDFFLPILLTLFFLPFLYLLAVFVAYETLFTQLKVFMHDDELRRFTKLELIRECGLDFERVTRWKNRYMSERPRSKEGVRESIHNRELSS